MKGELNLEQLDTAQAKSELSDADLEGVVGGKGPGFIVGPNGGVAAWGGGYGGYGGYGYRGYGGYGGYRGYGYRGYGYRGGYGGYGRRWW